MGDRNTLAQLIESLDGEADARRAAQAKLVAMGSEAVPALIEAVRSDQPRTAWGAITVLAELADPRAFEVLRQAIYTSNSLVASSAVKALQSYPAEDIQPTLIAALPQVGIIPQQSIILALQALNDQRSVQPLMDFLPQVVSPVIRCAVIKTLGIAGDTAAVPAILPYLHDVDHHVRDWAAFALAELGSP